MIKNMNKKNKSQKYSFSKQFLNAWKTNQVATSVFLRNANNIPFFVSIVKEIAKIFIIIMIDQSQLVWSNSKNEFREEKIEVKIWNRLCKNINVL